jgi:hypothetical protein
VSTQNNDQRLRGFYGEYPPGYVPPPQQTDVGQFFKNAFQGTAQWLVLSFGLVVGVAMFCYATGIGMAEKNTPPSKMAK